MKAKKVALAGVMAFLCVFLSGNIRVQAEEQVDAEVIILIDVSKTMRAFSDSVKKYAEFLDKSLEDTGIKVTWNAFADPGYIKPISNKLIEFNKDWTDQKGAFENTVKEMEQSDAQWKCIVMLSDAQLDYKDSEADEAFAEEEAEKQFINMVNAFAEKTRQKVVLVHFGDDWNLFKECNQASVLEGEKILERGLLEADTQEENQELLAAVFEGVGLESQELSVPVEGNQAEFTLKEDIYRMVFHIRGSAPDGENMDISVKREADGQIVEEYSCSRWANLGLFFFADIKQGQYIVTLPDGEWQCGMTIMKKISNYNVDISVKQGNMSVVKENDVYCIDTSNFLLDIQVKTDQSGEAENWQNDELNFLKVKYSIVPAGTRESGIPESSYKDIHSIFHEDSSSFQQEVDLKYVKDEVEGNASSESSSVDGDYECRVRIMQGDKVEYESSPIYIRVCKDSLPITPSPTTQPPVTECIYIGDVIDIKSEFGISEEGKNYYIKLNGKDFAHIEGTNVGEGYAKYEDGMLSFSRTGSYEVSIILEGDENYKNSKCYEVCAKNCMQRIWDWFFGLFNKSLK